MSRIVVNCGIPYSASDTLALAARSTAAHSTLSPDHTPQAEFLGAKGNWLQRKIRTWLARRLGAVIISGSNDAVAERNESPHSTQLVASHEAYRDLYGFSHRRRWNLHTDGMTLQGEDILVFDDESEFIEDISIRFHLAPGVRASIAPSGHSIIMELPNGEGWQFSSELHEITLEESLFFSVTDGARRIQQIVLRIIPEQKPNIQWRFDRIRKPIDLQQSPAPPDLESLL